MYRYILGNTFLETLKVIWIQNKANIRARLNMHLDGDYIKATKFMVTMCTLRWFIGDTQQQH